MKSFKGYLNLMALAFGMRNAEKDIFSIKPEPKKRPCLYCSKLNDFSRNSFCSAECCKAYKKAEKEIRTNTRLNDEAIRIKRHINSPCFDGTSHVRPRIIHY